MKKNMSELDRFKLVFQHFKSEGFTQETFSEKLGITQAQLSRLLNGLSPVLMHHKILLEYLFNVSLDWIEEGKDPMILDAMPKVSEDKTFKVIVQNYNRMSKGYRAELKKVSTNLLHQYKSSNISRVADKKIEYMKKPRKKKG